MQTIRPPVFAGSFYPLEKKSLQGQIQTFLGKTKKFTGLGKLKILIVPHAGYPYSGQTAAWGYQQLIQENFQTIILLGCSHRAFFPGAAIYTQGAWQTPLGKVLIDEQLAQSLINQSNLFSADTTTHSEEHSLEVQLPFLQEVSTDFKIVPILLGQTNQQLLVALSEAISQHLTTNNLLVISSDLSHYPAYEVAKKVDQNTIDAILSGKVDQFCQTVSSGLNLPGVETCACGSEAIKIGLMAAKKLNLKKTKLFNYLNSGDTGNDRSQVVGYGSIGFYN